MEEDHKYIFSSLSFVISINNHNCVFLPIWFRAANSEISKIVQATVPKKNLNFCVDTLRVWFKFCFMLITQYWFCSCISKWNLFCISVYEEAWESLCQS